MNDEKVFLTIGRAAAAAGVAPRTAFRWVEEGRLEVRPQGASRLVEVGALRTLAQRGAPPVARASATAPAPNPGGDPPSSPARLAAVEAGISALRGRLGEIERRLGIVPGTSGDRAEGEAP